MNTVTLPSLYPVTCHTDHVGPGSTFVAIKGMSQDGAAYIPHALTRGARRIVVQEGTELTQDIVQLIASHNAELVYVPDTRKALALLSAQELNWPARKLRIIGITGTKGKSTTAFLVEHMLACAGFKTALLTTVKNRILDQDFTTELTTQQPDYLHIFFNACVQQGVQYVVMEVAAQAVTLHRIAGITFDSIIFTNFSAEHGEFYKKIDDYFAAKAALLGYLKPGACALLASDDPRIWQLGTQLGRVVSFGLSKWADVRARVQDTGLNGIRAHIFTPTEHFAVHAPELVGQFNVYNILAAVALMHILGVPEAQVVTALASFTGVPGRLQRFVLPNGAIAFIDYAHNPASFEAVLSALRPLSDHLLVVFGGGGDRDKSKRPLMGAIAARIADGVILTTDNPRSEDPQVITAEIQAGIPPEYAPKVQVELDRQQAIYKAYALSRADTMIVLLGKGPDEYQLVKGVKTPFSEKAILHSF